MQRRRQTPSNSTTLFPSPTPPITTTNYNHPPSLSSTTGHPRPSANSATATTVFPSSSLMYSGIELRDRPAHGTSSSISSRTAPYQRASLSTVAESSAYQPPAYHAQPTISNTIFIMKPLVGAMQAWSCVVISVFAIIILSIMGLLFKNDHHEMVGGIEDPENGPEVAATIFIAVLIYAGFLVFCGLQGLLHLRENRRGAIAL